MVLGGMVGESPHMVASSVMALARLLYEFGGALAGSVPELMPAVLSLLRSRAREVVKAVLGFLKVCVFFVFEQPDILRIIEGCGLRPIHSALPSVISSSEASCKLHHPV